MATNQRTEGCVIPYTVPSSTTITSGQYVAVGDLAGVALQNGTTGDVIDVALEGVFELPKTTSQAWTQGAKLYWKAGTSKVTNNDESAANAFIGWAWLAAGSADTTGEVKLKQS